LRQSPRARSYTPDKVQIDNKTSYKREGAVLILLSLFSLGIKAITLGSKLPAFVSPNVLGVLVNEFDLKPNTTVDTDLDCMVRA
jgi:hydroxylamine reductase